MPASSRVYVERPRAGSLGDSLDVVLDRGMIVDGFMRVRPIGLELVALDGRAVIAGIDTYLRFADAVNHFDFSAAAVYDGPARLGRG